MGVRRDNYPLDSVPVLQCCPSLPECNAALRCTRCTVHNRNSPWPIEQREHWIIRYCLRGPRCLQACNLTNFLNDKQWQYIESGCVEKTPTSFHSWGQNTRFCKTFDWGYNRLWTVQLWHTKKKLLCSVLEVWDV